MSLTSYRAAPPRGGMCVMGGDKHPAWRPGGDRLSRILRCSTMGAGVFHGRVRDGIGCIISAMTTGPPCRMLVGDLVICVAFGCERGLVLCAVSACAEYAMENQELDRAIRIARLHGLPHFHLRPINVMVYHGPRGRPRFEGGFLLRCLQQLSRPHLATQRCSWRNNWYTRGTSIPVLSY